MVDDRMTCDGRKENQLFRSYQASNDMARQVTHCVQGTLDCPFGPFSSGDRFGAGAPQIEKLPLSRVQVYLLSLALIGACSITVQSLNYHCSAKVHLSMDKLNRLAVKMVSSGAD